MINLKHLCRATIDEDILKDIDKQNCESAERSSADWRLTGAIPHASDYSGRKIAIRYIQNFLTGGE